MHVVVVGAGIGGLAAGALLARRGESVLVLEATGLPGGCAATFSRGGRLFDAGATVGCGFHEGGPLERLGRELGIEWPVRPEPVAWSYRCGDLELDLDRTGKAVLERFPSSAPFWKAQRLIARELWRLSGEGLAWPPSGPRDWAKLLLTGIKALPGSARLLPYLNRSALDWIASFGLGSDREFLRFIDAQLLIATQAPASGTSALNAAIALDLPAAGTFRVEGGMGTVAGLLVRSIEENGGGVLYGRKVERVDTVGREVVGVETSDGGAFAADLVVANLTPRTLAAMEGLEGYPISPDRLESPWSACTVYLDAPEGALSALRANHLQIVRPAGELGEGNSIFVSVSPAGDAGRAPAGRRALTVSTHTRPGPWFEARAGGKEAYLAMKRRYADVMLGLLETHLPGIRARLPEPTVATPVSWERWTGRSRGLVGGYAQSSLFGVRGPDTPWRNLKLVGDSIFPGQSLPGVVTGARRTLLACPGS
ncbi:NAD(P)/FAD-dependent oxidoreductase [Chlorobium sp. N1]|uniref:phytoene desaturase family protein n=1 Tax=Chlorobium sp. N1 TaxID=2491138 RepID=UPI00103C9A97|nr:NAD(P)/FAD-dependent oxidoreductase [Chlorobium sp. N1]TCD48011.1 FAD-dependent oxidoreductase [Chlorobium sp. N1]